MNVRYRVELSQADRCELGALLNGGRQSARKLKRAQILLAADAGLGDEEIGRARNLGQRRVQQRHARIPAEALRDATPQHGVAGEGKRHRHPDATVRARAGRVIRTHHGPASCVSPVRASP